ncbi:type IV secretion protein Rhs [Spartobacteria bacterium LR76]|nr:type IV secretion protein Rhs [Spartobacteria bacterium LR76]
MKSLKTLIAATIFVTFLHPVLADMVDGCNPISVFLGTNEVTGPKYRKVGLNGFPIPDEKPQAKEETDQEPEETYIDAMGHTLTHQVTDVYVPFSGTDLTLSVRRNWNTLIWSPDVVKTYLRPYLHLGGLRGRNPFGDGWTSNISASITISRYSAKVIDENGVEYGFITMPYVPKTNGEQGVEMKFFPRPETRHQQDVMATSLNILPHAGDQPVFYEFKRKFGTTLTFEVRPGLSSAGMQSLGIECARLVKIVDRYGTQIDYTYPTEYETLVPEAISMRGKRLLITQDDNGRVTSISDPNGNVTTYDYDVSPFVLSEQFNKTFPFIRLKSVAKENGATTMYGYEMVAEYNKEPKSPGVFLHVDLTSITDPNGSMYVFEYAVDNSKWAYKKEDNIGGWYTTAGNPRNVKKVTLPNGDCVTFQNSSKVWIGKDDEGREELMGSRRMIVTDAAGGEWIYDFSDSAVERMGVFTTWIAFDAPIAGSAELPEASHETLQIIYQKMSVSTPQGGQMVATFDKTAGMALKSFQDVSSPTPTTFEYGDDFDFALRYNWPALPGGAGEEIPVKWGDVTKQINGEGKEKTFTYDPTWRVMNRSVDEEGRVTENEIDPANGNRLSEVILATTANSAPEFQRTDFVYDSSFPGILHKKLVRKKAGDPLWVADLVTEYTLQSGTGNISGEKVGSNRPTRYTYDNNNNKLTTQDPNNNITRFTYDSVNRLTKVSLPGGSEKKTFYDARGNKIREDDELGRSTLREYDSLNRVVKEARDMDGNHAIDSSDLVTETTYTKLNGKETVKSPNGWVTTMAYDGLNRLVKTTDPYGKETTFEYGENSGGLQFGRDFMPVKVTDPLGYETLTTYDATYRPIEKKAEYQDGVYAVTKYEYDDVGNLVREYDPLTTTLVPRITQKTYDALNRETSTIWPDLTATHTYYTSTGLKWKVEDELGNDTLTEYDDAGRPVKVSSPEVDNGLGVTARAVTQTQYDDAGNVIKTINPLGYEWTFTYDNRNRKLTETRPGTGTPTLHWAYDAAGNVVKTTDARGNETDTTYDAANRVTKVEQPSVAIYGGGSQRPTTLTEYDRNGNATKVTDANGHETVNTYDKLNRLVTTTDAESIVVRNEYDFAGNRTAIVDGKNQRTEFTYDGLKRNLTVKDAGNKTTTFQYNAVDKTARVDAMGHRTEYGYDLRHRLTTVNYVGRTQDNRVMTYDATGNLLTVTEPDASKAGKADVGYTYDALKRQLTETSGGLTHQYKYDLAGNRISVLYGGLSVPLISAYDAQNRLSTLTQGPLVTTYAYDLDGNILTKTLPNGDATTSTFDAANRTTTLVSTRGSGGLPLSSYMYAYDPAANVKQVTEAYADPAMDRVVTNTYDAINRLTQEAVTGSGAGTTLYSYDNAHNRETMTKGGVLASYSYNSRNQLTSFTEGSSRTVSYTYDDNGNRLTRTEGINTDTFTWDNENRLIALAKASLGGSGTYGWGYDYRTRRVELAYNTTVTKAVFSGGTEVREFENGLPSVDYVRGSDWGGGVGGILYTERAGVPSFTHYNRRGDVTAKTDATGNITYQATYEAFGKRVTEAGTTLDRQKSNTKDEDVPGYANEGFRFRDLETGAFLSQDPAGFVDGPNLYAYVRQNPWTKFDPEGLAENENEKKKPSIIERVKETLNHLIRGELNKKSAGDTKPSETAKGRSDKSVGDIKGNAYAQEMKQSCAPAALRTVVQTVTGDNPGEARIREQVDAAQGTVGQNWNSRQGGTISDGFEKTMSKVLKENGVKPSIKSNLDKDGNPSAGKMADNITSTESPAIIGVKTPGGQLHAVTAQNAGDGTIQISNLNGRGGVTTVTQSQFSSGSIPAAGGSFTVQPQTKIIIGNPR